MDYYNSFSNRAKSYLYAVNRFPHVLDEEIKNILSELDVSDNQIILNLNAGGVYLNKFLPQNVSYLPFDFNKEFADEEKINYCSHDCLPFENQSVDKIVICAVLHHFSEEERSTLYKECHRILKNDGIFLVADVVKDSPQDYWLNTVVNQYNPNGHAGLFFDDDDKTTFINCNFLVETKIKKYNWKFDDTESMLEFMKSFFYLRVEDDELLDLIKVLNYEQDRIDWKLIYFIAKKA
jgi:predicted SAM-dependent methyltransferase